MKIQTATKGLKQKFKLHQLSQLVAAVLFFMFVLSSPLKAHSLENWDNSITADPYEVIQLLKASAHEQYYHEDDKSACGAEAWGMHIVDYYTWVSHYGNITSRLLVNLYVTASADQCVTETVLNCNVPLTVEQNEEIYVGPWHCEVVGENQ